MVVSGIPYNVHEGTERQYKMINSYLEMALHTDARKIDAPTESHQGSKDPALKQAQKIRPKEDEKIVFEKTVTDSDLK